MFYSCALIMLTLAIKTFLHLLYMWWCVCSNFVKQYTLDILLLNTVNNKIVGILIRYLMFVKRILETDRETVPETMKYQHDIYKKPIPQLTLPLQSVHAPSLITFSYKIALSFPLEKEVWMFSLHKYCVF